LASDEEDFVTREAQLLSGIILVTVPSIQYGGYFLLTSLMDKSSGYMDNPLRQNFFRAGHAHAGVIVILSLVCQVLADAALLPPCYCGPPESPFRWPQFSSPQDSSFQCCHPLLFNPAA
jgi:hypothetical protein